MTQLNGFELYSKIREVDKKTRVCFISAFQIYYDDVKYFANKPISIERLAALMRDELHPTLIIKRPGNCSFRARRTT